MSGELQIVFIYDTLRCRREEDDPKDAILYFHPADIAEERRIAICGQLMGITHFLVDAFSAPQILTLENGKFALRKFGKQYILALGCSSITPDWLLEKQADILYSLTRFFHRDIQSVLENSNGDRGLLTKKLTAMMDHYIPVSQHHGDLFALTFGILPILSLPKSANNISLQGSLILQTCMMKPNVLGGIVMYQNKVVGVELSQNVAQKLAFIQPYSLPPAEMVKVDFKLPPGVQLFTVYVWEHELEMLRKRATAFQHPTAGDDAETRDGVSTAIDPIREEDPSDVSSSIGFSEVSSSICLDEASNHPSSLTASSTASDSDVKAIQLAEKGQIESGVVSAECDFKLKVTGDEAANGCNLKPCSHLNVFSNSFTRRFRSLEDVRSHEEDVCKQSLNSSLADPEFPYILCDGRAVSKHLFDYVTMPIDAECSQNELNDSASETQLCQPSLEPGPNSQTHEVPPADMKTLTTVSTPSSVRRPMNLPLNSSESTQRRSRRWSTFEDMMSPIGAFPSSFQETPILNEHKNILDSQYASSDTADRSTTSDRISDELHLRMVDSFKKLSSHEDLSSCPSSSDNENFPASKKAVSSSSTSLPKPTFPVRLRKDKRPHVATSAPRNVQSWEEKYEKACLYMYSHGSMRLLLLIDTQYKVEPAVIQALHEYGVVGLCELERAITNVEELNLSLGAGQNDPYCYLRYEPVWKSLAQGGRNQSMDFEIVQLMHRDFASYQNLSELIIRGEDHVVYGYRCVGSEVYYQQSANILSGLPMPSDLMGKVPLEAKNRLERDHNIILL